MKCTKRSLRIWIKWTSPGWWTTNWYKSSCCSLIGSEVKHSKWSFKMSQSNRNLKFHLKSLAWKMTIRSWRWRGSLNKIWSISNTNYIIPSLFILSLELPSIISVLKPFMNIVTTFMILSSLQELNTAKHSEDILTIDGTSQQLMKMAGLMIQKEEPFFCNWIYIKNWHQSIALLWSNAVADMDHILEDWLLKTNAIPGDAESTLEWLMATKALKNTAMYGTRKKVFFLSAEVNKNNAK